MGGGDRADRCPGCCCISTAGPTVGFGMRHHPKSPVHGNLLTRGRLNRQPGGLVRSGINRVSAPPAMQPDPPSLPVH